MLYLVFFKEFFFTPIFFAKFSHYFFRNVKCEKWQNFLEMFFQRKMRNFRTTIFLFRWKPKLPID